MDHTDAPTPILKESSGPKNFTTLNHNQVKAIWDIIRTLDSRKHPVQILHAFELVALNINQDTGEIMLTRNQFAQEIGCSPDKVSSIMSALVDIGIVIRERKTTKGLRGLVKVVYFINTNICP